MSTIVPKFDRVLIKRESFKKDSVIFIPDEIARDNAPARGVVVAVGPTAYISDKDGNKVEEIVVGSHVIFARHAGSSIKEGDEEYWICQDTDILAELREVV